MRADRTHFSKVEKEALQLIPKKVDGDLIKFSLSEPVIPGSQYNPELQMWLEEAKWYQESSGRPASHLKIELNRSNEGSGIKTISIVTKLGGHASVKTELMHEKTGDIRIASILSTIEGLFLESRRATQGDILVYENCLEQLQNRSL